MNDKPAPFGEGFKPDPDSVAKSVSTIDETKWVERAEEHRAEMKRLESPIRRLQVGLPIAKLFLSPLLAAAKMHPVTSTIAAYIESAMRDLEDKVKTLSTPASGG